MKKALNKWERDLHLKINSMPNDALASADLT